VTRLESREKSILLDGIFSLMFPISIFYELLRIYMSIANILDT